MRYQSVFNSFDFYYFYYAEGNKAQGGGCVVQE